MKNTLRLALCLTTLAMTLSPVTAETYRWKDASGRTVYSDTPPPGGVKPQTTADNASAEPGQKTKSTAEQDMAFKKRLKDAADKAEKDGSEAALSAQRQENCERAQRAVAALESNQPVSILNAKGERTTVDDSQRQAELERARKIAEDSCK